MKIRSGFVSNSSSCSFIITNTSYSSKTLVDFHRENTNLLDEFIVEYQMESISQNNLENDARERNITWTPGETKTVIFGDEQRDKIGQVYDYMLREGGRSKSFTWTLGEMLR